MNNVYSLDTYRIMAQGGYDLKDKDLFTIKNQDDLDLHMDNVKVETEYEQIATQE